MSKIAVIYNERASSAQNSIWKDEIRNNFFRHEVIFHSPENLNKLKDTIQGELDSGTKNIFAIGGDGTANVIIQELAGTDANLFLIPAGTANDLANELGIEKSIKKITQIYQHRTTSQIDLIKINNKFMTTNGGIGLAANVAKKINSYRKSIPAFKNLMRYSKSSIYSIVLAKEMVSGLLSNPRNPQNMYYKVLITSKEFPQNLNPIIETPMVFINNQSILGGQFKIAPNTKNNDGIFNVTILTHKSFVDLAKATIRVKNGEDPASDPEIITFETSQLTIKNLDNIAMPFFGDGEIIERSTDFDISISDKKLNFFCFSDLFNYSTSYSLQEFALSTEQ